MNLFYNPKMTILNYCNGTTINIGASREIGCGGVTHLKLSSLPREDVFSYQI